MVHVVRGNGRKELVVRELRGTCVNATRLEPIATRLEAIAISFEAIATRLEAHVLFLSALFGQTIIFYLEESQGRLHRLTPLHMEMYGLALLIFAVEKE